MSMKSSWQSKKTIVKYFQKKGGKKINSIQKWIPIEKIYERGIIKTKRKYIKILKIIPINFNLKTQLEKDAILNAYKIFLKSCNFNLQILIQSKKEDLNQHIQNIKKSEKNNKIIKKYSEEYIKFIQEKNNENKSASKNIYLIIENNNLINKENIEENIFQELNEKYFKIKENLNRCGNNVLECSKKEIIEILYSFLNSKKYLEKKEEIK